MWFAEGRAEQREAFPLWSLHSIRRIRCLAMTCLLTNLINSLEGYTVLTNFPK